MAKLTSLSDFLCNEIFLNNNNDGINESEEKGCGCTAMDFHCNLESDPWVNLSAVQCVEIFVNNWKT